MNDQNTADDQGKPRDSRRRVQLSEMAQKHVDRLPTRRVTDFLGVYVDMGIMAERNGLNAQLMAELESLGALQFLNVLASPAKDTAKRAAIRSLCESLGLPVDLNTANAPLTSENTPKQEPAPEPKEPKMRLAPVVDLGSNMGF